MNDYESKLQLLPKKELSLARLIRAKEVNDTIYSMLLEKLQEARITEASKVGDVQIIDTAEKPISPIRPNKIKNLMYSNAEIRSRTERKRNNRSEVNRLNADITKSLRLINWKPKYTLDEGLKITIDWFSKKENLDFYKLGYNI